MNKEKSGGADVLLPKGLSSEEVRLLTEEGQMNISKVRGGKSYLRIVLDNLFTFFNLVWAIVAVILISVGSYENLTFLAVIIPNLLIAIIQESRAKADARRSRIGF